MPNQFRSLGGFQNTYCPVCIAIHTNELYLSYFDTIPYWGVLKYYNGLSWVKAKLKVHNGSTWVQKTLKVWDGSQFQTIDTTGV